MSQANVDLVTQLQPAPDVDIAELFRNDDMWSAAADAIAPLFTRTSRACLQECRLPRGSTLALTDSGQRGGSGWSRG